MTEEAELRTYLLLAGFRPTSTYWMGPKYWAEEYKKVFVIAPKNNTVKYKVLFPATQTTWDVAYNFDTVEKVMSYLEAYLNEQKR